MAREDVTITYQAEFQHNPEPQFLALSTLRIARVGVDSAGGLLINPLQTSVKVNGALVAVLGQQVASHGINEHAAAIMVEASGSVAVEGLRVCRAGDAASCGHKVTGGSGNVLAGD